MRRSTTTATAPDREATQTPRMTFVNLPVKDIATAMEFFVTLGFSFDPQVTDGNSACMVISDGAYVMLHAEPFFKEFTRSEITDTSHSREVTMGVSAASRAQVDDLVDRAVAAGGQAMGGPQDQGGMYMRAFRDPDGHQWSLLHLGTAGPPDGTDGTRPRPERHEP